MGRAGPDGVNEGASRVVEGEREDVALVGRQARDGDGVREGRARVRACESKVR